MTREERNQESIRTIVSAATAEFGANGYEGASMNTAMEKSQISKGRFYHYFESKDQLYLTCVQNCFDELLSRMQSERFEAGTPELLKHYFDVRWSFFQENPWYHRIFADAAQQPPAHLQAEIKKQKKSLDQFHLDIFRRLLTGTKLRERLSEQDAVEYFLMMQDAFYRFQADEAADLELRERKLRMVIDILLYGIAERGQEA